MLRQQCGITEGESPEIVTERVEQYLHHSGLTSETDLAYVLQLRGVQKGPNT